MAKSYQISFSDSDQRMLDEISELQHTTCRQFIINATLQAARKAREAVQAFEQTEYVFKMKDGSVKRMVGKNPGSAWQALGYTIEQAQELVLAHLPVDKAREEGWLNVISEGPRQDMVIRKTGAVAGAVEIWPTRDFKAEEDLPFGK